MAMAGTKRCRRAAGTAEGAKEDVVSTKLAAHGESFMSMFDDYDEQQQRQKRHAASTGQQHDHHEADEDSDEASSSGATTDEDEDAAAGPGPSSVEQFLYSGRKGMQHGAAAVQQPQETEADRMRRLLRERRMKKKFMSAKASNIFEDVAPPPVSSAAARDDFGLSAEEFQQMQREVEMLGGSALDRKARKAWQANMLTKLGAKADKTPRIAASIGRGMAKAAKKREAKALSEAIEAGMVQSKGMGKKNRAAVSKARDKGLQEAGPGFRNGVLHVRTKGPTAQAHGGGARSALRGFDKSGGLGGKPKGGANKKKGAAKKGGKKGGKRR